MDLGTQANLVFAKLDLQLVRLLRDAIRTADLAGAKTGALGLPARSPINAVAGPRDRFEPTPRFEPRKTIHPTPHFLPRPIFHERIDIDFSPSDSCGKSEIAAVDRTPLPPPWQMPVWKMPIQPAAKVKVRILRTDVHNKGSLIDLFL